MSDPNPNHAKSGLFRPSFIVVASILLVSALSLTAVVQALELHFKKEPVSLERPLQLAVPREFGPWVLASVDVPMGADIEEAMGTDEYLTRFYLNREIAGDLIPDNIAELTSDQLAPIVNRVVRDKPEAAVKLHMAYYTGSVDTVPHVPDRCMVAGGFAPVNPRTAEWNVLPTDDGFAPTKLRFVEFRDEAITKDGPAYNVAYFFQVNGEYEHDPITGVRAKLMSLTDTHAYFCKIELLCISPDSVAAEAAMENFLQHAMPSLEEVLPDWDRIVNEKPTDEIKPDESKPTADTIAAAD
ncbi:MAG: exosortase-associated EpsI family protein [Planctomycetota bacterium]